jgi:two-component system OmpR family response regulator
MPYTFLLISADDHARKTLAQQLALFGGPAIVQVASGKAGLELLRQGGFDAVLVESALPDMSGGDFCWLARRNGSRTPILVIGDDSESDLVLALESGAHDYLARPFGLSALLARLRVQLREHRGDAALAIAPFVFFSSARRSSDAAPAPATVF